MAELTDIEKAIEQIRLRSIAYVKPQRYYDGDHDLAFASEKFLNVFGKMFREFALNLCPAVVDSVKDKLNITGYRIEAGSRGKEGLSDDAWQIWQQNRMGKRAGEVHKEAVRAGDAYVIVWPDVKKKVTIYPQTASNCTVFYDPERPGTILWAAKYWQAIDKSYRLNMYYPDRIEKWATGPVKEKMLLPDANAFKRDEKDDVANPYGMVPVFHFANNADIGQFGRSELKDVLAVQDGLNKSVLDMLVAMEFAAYRQRWASGIEIEFDDEGQAIAPFKAGVERLWLTENENAKFGDFNQSDLEQFLKVKDSFRTDFATVSGTPLYYFMQTGANFPQSGESYRRSETRFVQKIRDRQEAFGNVWEDVIAFALMIENKGKDIRLFTEWEDAGRLSEAEELENLMLKKEIGVSDKQLLTEAGYGSDEIAQMMEERRQARKEMVTSFNRGESDDGFDDADPGQDAA